MDLDIFKYDDYRRFLSDYYESKKQKSAGFSHRVFSRQAGLSSPSYLKMVMEGQRNLSYKSMGKFMEALRLKAKERTYFEALVRYNQAKVLQEKTRYFEDVLQARMSKRPNALDRHRFDFLSKWYVVAIYCLVDTWDFEKDPHWIADRLRGWVSVRQVKEALKTLFTLDLIEEDKNGHIVQVTGSLSVDDDTREMAVFNYHKSMIDLSALNLKVDNLQEREMNGVTIPIPKDQLNVFKNKIREFRKELNQLAAEMENSDEVYQINLHMFPVTGEKK